MDLAGIPRISMTPTAKSLCCEAAFAMIFNNIRLEELTRLIEPTIILPGNPIICALRFTSILAHLNRLVVARRDVLRKYDQRPIPTPRACG